MHSCGYRITDGYSIVAAVHNATVQGVTSDPIVSGFPVELVLRANTVLELSLSFAPSCYRDATDLRD